jgi:hypothetical protein
LRLGRLATKAFLIVRSKHLHLIIQVSHEEMPFERLVMAKRLVASATAFTFDQRRALRKDVDFQCRDLYSKAVDSAAPTLMSSSHHPKILPAAERFDATDSRLRIPNRYVKGSQ